MKTNSAILLLGSNIDPQENLLAALELLEKQTSLTARSRVWETEAVGSSGPNFLNMAVKIKTGLDAEAIKSELITPIENKLGRVRTEDKYAARTIDIDVIIYNNQVLDPNLWEKAFIAIPVSELVPDLPHPQHEHILAEFAEELKSSAFAELFHLE